MQDNQSCDLSDKHCVPCRGGVPALKGAELQAWLKQLPAGWELVQEHHLTRSYKFPDFVKALAFVNELGAVAEGEGHHPDIFLAWGLVRLEIFTHKVDGLTESDFILAAKADRLYV